ncbi:MAG TPA: 3-phenylpropionate/cinnamic acid dioxygenase subunit beta [Burkholderiales bacterium]|nr:3-phenylpropionate/cinnamic acid dioxygenase subunit beta [Burkholderiales bacterium]
MADAAALTNADLSTLLRQHELEQYYYAEAALLDNRRYDEWLKLFTQDVLYFMPVRRTMTSNELDKEFTQPDQVAFFADTYDVLVARVKKLATGYAWAEDPPSRQRHMVLNVRVISDDGDELIVESSFHFYRTRLNSEEDHWIGLRRDKLRREEGSFKIARREIYLEQTVLLSRNLSNFF